MTQKNSATIKEIVDHVTEEVKNNLNNSEIAVYTPFRQQLAEIKQNNFKLVFDYASKQGNEEARSHVHKLRKSKAAVEKARKAEKAASLEYGRRVDLEANKIIEEFEEMIEVHQKPLDEFEEREKKRVDDILAHLKDLEIHADVLVGKSSVELITMETDVTAIDVTVPEAWGEFWPQAVAAKKVTLENLGIMITLAKNRERDAADLQRLRAEVEARRLADEEAARAAAAELQRKQDAEREAKVLADREAAEKKAAEEEAERLKKAQEAAAEAERKRVAKEAAERERLLKEQAARAEREKQELIDKAAREAKEAEERQAQAVKAESERIQRESDAKAAEDARREADKAHRGKIHSAIVAGMLAACNSLTEEQAKAIVIGICGDVVPHVKIVY